MRKTVCALVFCLLVALSLPAAARPSESIDPGYDFTKVRTVLVMEPTFAYSGVSGNNKFVKYPDSARTIAASLNGRLKKAANLRYVTLDYVTDRVKADPALDCDPAAPGFAALVKREMPKYVDLVLYLTIRDFGWLHEYQEAYEAYETVTDHVRYHGRTPDGKPYDGWVDVERTVPVYHPAHYHIIDSAEAQFGLLDPQTGKYVWSYGEGRTRLSPGGSGGYDRSGPESVMNRIFEEAVEKMPIYPRTPAKESVYN